MKLLGIVPFYYFCFLFRMILPVISTFPSLFYHSLAIHLISSSFPSLFYYLRIASLSSFPHSVVSVSFFPSQNHLVSHRTPRSLITSLPLAFHRYLSALICLIHLPPIGALHSHPLVMLFPHPSLLFFLITMKLPYSEALCCFTTTTSWNWCCSLVIISSAGSNLLLMR